MAGSVRGRRFLSRGSILIPPPSSCRVVEIATTLCKFAVGRKNAIYPREQRLITEMNVRCPLLEAGCLFLRARCLFLRVFDEETERARSKTSRPF